MLFTVAEKLIVPGRGFVMKHGLWYGTITAARRGADLLKPHSLAHRMFICNSTGLARSKLEIPEEVELPSLEERLEAVHRPCLQAHDRQRLSREMLKAEQLPEWRRRLIAPFRDIFRAAVAAA